MRERLKRLIAIIMALALVGRMSWAQQLVAYAAEVSITSYSYIVDESTDDTLVFESGGHYLTIEEGVTVGGVTSSLTNEYDISNSGTINTLDATLGAFTIRNGNYGSISVGSNSGIFAESITATSVYSVGSLTFSGTNYIGTLDATSVSGSGTVHVSDELSLGGISNLTISVGRDTVINTDSGEIALLYDGKEYTIPDDSIGTSIFNEYSTVVSIESDDGNATWSSTDGKLDTKLWYGEAIGTYDCVAADGYYFPDTYTDMVTTTGQAIPTVTRVDEKNIQISYTVADTDKGTAIITLPALNPLETGTGSITVPDIYVGETYSPVVDSDTNPIEDAIVEYKVKGVSDETYSATAPTTAGDYVARVILPAQGIYAELVLTDEFSILKREGSATFAVEDIVYGGTITHELTSTTHDIDGALIEYKLLDADDVEYSPDAPTEVGSYVARVTLLETAEYNKVELTDEFAILKAEGSAELSVADTVYGDEISVSLTSTTHDIATAVVEYMEAGADESTYTTIVPTAVGDYMIRISLAANESYNQVIKTAAFAILKAEGAATVTIEDAIYGETVSPVVTSETHDVATAVIEYKLADETDTAYKTTVPTAVGSYVVRATLATNESYEEVVATAEFDIIKAEGAATVTIEDVIYGETVTPVVTSETHDVATAVVEYKLADEADTAYKATVPTAVGSYVVRVTLATNESYEEVVETAEFDIIKAEGAATVTIEDAIYGETVAPVVTSETHDVATAVVEYKLADEADTAYKTTVPTAVGSYVVRATLATNESYEEVVATAEFDIIKAVGDVTFNIEDVSYGEEITLTVVSTVYDVSSAVVQYKATGADDSTYTTVTPTAVGNYIAQVILAATESYEEKVETAEFSISRADGTATITVQDVIYGDAIKPVVKSDTHDIASAVVEYRLATEADTAYTEAVPTEAGNYVARVTFAQNDYYNAVTATTAFSIKSVEGVGSLVVADTYYGIAVVPQITSDTNSTSGTTVEYKVYGNNDSTYTSKVPTAVGKYVARVILPGNNNYDEMVITDEFSINYLPIPDNAYSLVGNMGENGYYTSEVNIVAKDGYVISNSLDGEYVESITVASSSEAMTVYFMEKSTGAKTSALSIAAIDIDVDAPQVDAKSDNTYYGDSLAVAISDNNLASVTLNGENIEIDGARTVLELKSNGGVEEYTVVVTDNAGHTRNIVITVAAEWTKTGEIPNGTQVRLEAGTSYSLGSGTWTVNGDATSYSGNTTFYVSGESQFIFNQQ